MEDRLADLTRCEYDKLLRTYCLPECHEALTKPVLDFGRMHLACLSGRIDHSSLEHGSLRSSIFPHDLRRWPLFVLRIDANHAHDALTVHDLALVTNFLD